MALNETGHGPNEPGHGPNETGHGPNEPGHGPNEPHSQYATNAAVGPSPSTPGPRDEEWMAELARVTQTNADGPAPPQ